MRGRGDLRHAGKNLHIRRAVIEMIVADEATIGFAAQLPVFLFVDFLEERALVPGSALVFLQRLAEFLL